MLRAPRRKQKKALYVESISIARLEIEIRRSAPECSCRAWGRVISPTIFRGERTSLSMWPASPCRAVAAPAISRFIAPKIRCAASSSQANRDGLHSQRSKRSDCGFSRSIGGGISPSFNLSAYFQNGLKHFAVKNQHVIENAILAREVHLVVHTNTSLEGVSLEGV